MDYTLLLTGLGVTFVAVTLILQVLRINELHKKCAEIDLLNDDVNNLCRALVGVAEWQDTTTGLVRNLHDFSRDVERLALETRGQVWDLDQRVSDHAQELAEIGWKITLLKH